MSITRNGSPILVELINLVNTYNFSISNNLTQMVNIPAWILDCDSHSPPLLDLLIASDASICSAIVYFHWKILIMLLSQFPLTFHQIHNGVPCFIGQCMTILVLDWDGLRDHLRDVSWQDIFKLGASAAASEFCDQVQVKIDVYISHRKYKVDGLTTDLLVLLS